MGQKVHPITVRLQNNRTFDAGWFNENFVETFKKELLLRKAIVSFFNVLSQAIPGIYIGRMYFQKGYMKNIITLFIHKEENVKESKNRYKIKKPAKFIIKKKNNFSYSKRNYRNPADLYRINNYSVYGKEILTNPEFNRTNVVFKTEKNTVFSLLHNHLVKLISKKKFNGLFLFNKPNYNKLFKEIFANAIKTFKHTKEDQKRFDELIFQMIYFSMLDHVGSVEQKQIGIESKLLRKLSYNGFERNEHFLGFEENFTKKTFIENQKSHKLLMELENSLSSLCNENINLRPVFSTKSTFSAGFLADKIVSILEKNQRKKRTPYKAIKRLLNKSSSKCLGFRILCSGRLGGVEMAKKFSIKKGETSLNVFSQKIDFSQRKALTKYGIIGVKVWISFR